MPRLLIPVRDGAGRIQACQMRLPFAAKKGLRYLWLSSSDLPNGTGSGSPLHFKFRLADLPRDARIVIVEGVLKADVLSALRPDLYIVATPCVTANHAALVELTRGRLVWTAFDQDHYGVTLVMEPKRTLRDLLHVLSIATDRGDSGTTEITDRLALPAAGADAGRNAGDSTAGAGPRHDGGNHCADSQRNWRNLSERGYDDSAADRVEAAQREETGGRKCEDVGIWSKQPPAA